MIDFAIDAALITISAFVVVTTLLPLWRATAWWVRGWEFGRIQIAVLAVVAIGGLLLSDFTVTWRSVALILVAACLVEQVRRIVPYTPLVATQSKSAPATEVGTTLSVMVANVLMSNRNAARLIEIVEQRQPDIVFFAETDAWWVEQLGALGDTFPHRVEHPLDNTYGLLLLSRLELIEPTIRHLLQDDVPSVHAQVRLDGRLVDLHCIHPKPPYPAESPTAAPRDAEILIVGREIGDSGRPTIVAGDFNDVAWSVTTRLFQRVSGLLDPRIGRGLFSTFHARWPFMRWPLDHIFHSVDFALVSIERLPAFDSDHFPVSVRLGLSIEAEEKQEPPEAEHSDLAEARERIAEADPEAS